MKVRTELTAPITPKSWWEGIPRSADRMMRRHESFTLSLTLLSFALRIASRAPAAPREAFQSRRRSERGSVQTSAGYLRSVSKFWSSKASSTPQTSLLEWFAFKQNI